ncbi:MAG: hypothetical protein RJA07_1682 [Bacteroidota bacterium]|jgi:hypothetical protein
MMAKFFACIVLAYHLFGNLCLPMGDYSMLADLPKMYQHCKATEDAELDVFDFITDHLLNFDTVFEIHEDGEKPHQTNPINHSIQQLNFHTPVLFFSFSIKKSVPIVQSIFIDNFTTTDFLIKIFRPPIACCS